jgi:hypothetical protein
MPTIGAWCIRAIHLRDGRAEPIYMATALSRSRKAGAVTDIKLLALWTGWCDPCGEERPLALTEHGRRGLRAWLGGVGAEDRTLLLACELCGVGQDVPRRESDDPDDPEVILALLPEVVTLMRPSVPEPCVPVPFARRAPDIDQTLNLLAEGLDVITVGAR